MLSIIIPTLNEEKYLPFLVESIKGQNFSDYEIIVADAGSKDKTREIAEGYGCKITAGGLPGKGRNKGALAAKGEMFLFLDADTILPKDFLEKSLEEFKKRNFGIASFYFSPHKKSAFLSLLYNLFYNFPILLTERILPHAAVGILIKRDLFFKLNGFDESILIAEDHDLARRAKKIAKAGFFDKKIAKASFFDKKIAKASFFDKKIARYGLLKSTRILVSDRRFRNDGWIKTSFKYFLCELYIIFFGPIRTNIFHYKFNHYKKDLSSD